jgi:hypothetical protein
MRWNRSEKQDFNKIACCDIYFFFHNLFFCASWSLTDKECSFLNNKVLIPPLDEIYVEQKCELKETGWGGGAKGKKFNICTAQ